MPKLEFTPQELKAYFSDDVNARHCFYEKSKEAAEEMAVHANGEYPCKLLDARRPNEPLEVQEYRKTIFIPKTKPYFSKIVSSLSKIRRSSDWSIRYEGEFNKIREGETLEDYCEYNFPYFTSLTNWIFSVWLKKYLVDPNAVIFIYPEILPIDNEYLKPFPFIFDSCQVIDFVAEDYAVIENPEGCVYTNTKGDYSGKSYFIITTERIQRYDQADGKGTFTLMVDYLHGLAELPVYKIGAIINETEGKRYLYESRIAGVKPEFDEALREYSDLQAAKVLHIYPERWEYTQHECSDCNGTGKRRNPRWVEGCDASIPCDIECDNKSCYKGYVQAGPYAKIMIRPNSAMEGQQPVPTPPAGFVEKDVEIVKVQEESIDKHIFNALASINFEFLVNTPLNQSGTAKEVDKDELNNGVHAIAEDMVRNMDWIYWITAKYRYQLQYKQDELINMVPSVSVPEKYDILSSKHFEEQLKAAKDSKTNPAILNALEIEYAGKAFNADPNVRERVELVLSLDPLANISEDDKNSRLQNKGILTETYIISSNINEFVQRALEETEGFAEMDFQEQKDIINKYAAELAAEQDKMKIELAEDEVDEEDNVIEVGNTGGSNNSQGGNGFNGTSEEGTTDEVEIGKLPLAIQQLSLAAQRAADVGNTSLAARLNKKIDELLSNISI